MLFEKQVNGCGIVYNLHLFLQYYHLFEVNKIEKDITCTAYIYNDYLGSAVWTHDDYGISGKNYELGKIRDRNYPNILLFYGNVCDRCLNYFFVLSAICIGR